MNKIIKKRILIKVRYKFLKLILLEIFIIFNLIKGNYFNIKIIQMI